MTAPSRKLLFAAALVAAAGCSMEASLDDCEGSCDQELSYADKLEARHDPIAEMLKGDAFEIDEDGIGDIDYRSILLEMADQQGCGTSSINTFIISDDLFSGGCAATCPEDDPDCVPCDELSEEEIVEGKFPRLVSVVCADDTNKASEFFLNTVSEEFDEDDNATGQLQMRDLELFAWDPVLKKYNFYATFPVEDSDTSAAIDVGPQRCQQCHLTPSDTDPVAMPMTPIMNEINRPWTHWNASPGFESHAFAVPPRFLVNDEFQFIQDNWMSQAADLERIMAFGAFQRVSSARAFERRNAPDLDKAMGMLRPLFCAEQLNYVSEQGTGGSMFGTAIIDPGIKDVYKRLMPTDSPWDWFHNDSLVIPSEIGEPINQVPIRGVADVTFQASLISGRVVSPEQALRARSIDWQNPAYSSLRCEMWRSAYAHFQNEPPDFGDARRLLNVTGDLFEQIMSMGGHSLDFGDKILVVDSARPDISQEISAGLAEDRLASASCDDAGYCLLSLAEFGDRIQSYYKTFDGQEDARAKLKAVRDERICHLTDAPETSQARFEEAIANGQVITRFMNAPALPSVQCE